MVNETQTQTTQMSKDLKILYNKLANLTKQDLNIVNQIVDLEIELEKECNI